MDLPNDLLLLANLIRFVLFVPLHPFHPHLYHFVFLELSGDGESGHCVDVCVEISTMFEMFEFVVEDVDDDALVGLYLGEFAVGDA